MSTAPVTADQITDPTSTATAAPPASDTPPGPVGELAPAGQPAAPQPSPMPASPDQGGPVPQGGQPQDNPNTHGWRAVLHGALQGLESHLKGAGKGLLTGGIPGAVAGAVSPQMAANAQQFRQQQQAAKIKFTNAEAASQAAEAAYRDAQREQMPKELQLQQDQLDQRTGQMWIQSGLYPVVAVPNTADGPHAAADQMMQKFGAVPSLVYLHMGDMLVGFDPASLASNSAVLSQVNNYQKITGGMQMNPAQLKAAPNKTQLTQEAAHIFNPAFPGMDKAQGLISQYDGYIKSVSMWPDDDPEKAETLDKLKQAQTQLKNAYAARNKDQMAAAAARGAAAQNAKVIDVDVNGERKLMHAGEAVNAGAVTGGAGEKVRGKQAQFGDVYAGLDQMDNAIGGLEKQAKSGGKPVKLSPAAVAQLQIAANSEDAGVVQSAFQALNTQNLTGAQKDFVVAEQQLIERSMSLRNIAGQGQTSDSLRGAAKAMLPAARSGDTDFMRRQMKATRNFVQNLGQGQQTLPGQTKSATTPGAPQNAPANPPQQQFTHISASGDYGWDGKQWVKITKQ